jgi:hypothetical protein
LTTPLKLHHFGRQSALGCADTPWGASVDRFANGRLFDGQSVNFLQAGPRHASVRVAQGLDHPVWVT